MEELLLAVERNAIVIRERAIKVLCVLDTAENLPIPLQYQQVMGALSGLLPLWTEHTRLLSQAEPWISGDTDRMAIAVLRQFQENIADTGFSLEITSSAGWARTPALGIHALRLRVTTTVGNILCQMAREQATLIPLLRRSAVPTPTPFEHSKPKVMRVHV
jgi:hypothetical protein